MVCIDEYFCCNAFQVLNIKNQSQFQYWIYEYIILILLNALNEQLHLFDFSFILLSFGCALSICLSKFLGKLIYKFVFIKMNSIIRKNVNVYVM